MKFYRHKKLILGAIIILFFVIFSFENVFAITAGEVATGALDVLGGPATSVATAPMRALLYVIKYLLVYIIALAVFLVNFAINLGDNILKVPAVIEGWKVMVNFTNLGFVLGIIIIAFATIFHLENYAIKQTLTKLIVAALLVNFSLVIAGGFISVSKITTDTFYNHMTSGGKNLSDVLGSLAQPQKGSEPKSEFEIVEIVKSEGKAFFSFSGSLKIITSLAFQILIDFIIILTFLSLFIMLLVRVMALIFLLILSPAAWLLWIFPATKKYCQQWWQEFIRWNFFAPAIMFFLYLTVLTKDGLDKFVITGVKTGDPAAKALADLTILGGGFWQYIMNTFVLMSLLIGGLYVANKFGIAGGSIGINLAKKAGKGVGAWAGRKTWNATQRGATGWLNKPRGEDQKSYADRIARWSTKSKLAKIPGIGAAAQGITKLAGMGEKQVGEAKKNISGKSINEQIAMLGRANAPERSAILQNLQEKDLLSAVPDIDRYLTHGERAAWQKNGQGKSFEKIEMKLGRNVEMATGKGVDGKEINSEKIKEIREGFYGKYKLEDWQKTSPDLFTDAKYGDLATKEMLTYYPAALGKISAGVKKGKIGNFRKKIGLMEEVIVKDASSELDDIIKSIDSSVDIGASGLMDIDKKLEWIKSKNKSKYDKISDEVKMVPKIQKSVERNLAGRIIGSWEETWREKEEK